MTLTSTAQHSQKPEAVPEPPQQHTDPTDSYPTSCRYAILLYRQCGTTVSQPCPQPSSCQLKHRAYQPTLTAAAAACCCCYLHASTGTQLQISAQHYLLPHTANLALVPAETTSTNPVTSRTAKHTFMCNHMPARLPADTPLPPALPPERRQTPQAPLAIETPPVALEAHIPAYSGRGGVASPQ
jgi:hypothetical protein